MKPHKPEIVNDALRRHLSLSVRAEDLENFGELFVDPSIFDSTFNNSNQIVFGTRGSGKTSLLGGLTAQPIAQGAHGKILCLLFSTQDFLVSPPPDPTLPQPKALAFAYFQTFVRKLVEELEKHVTAILDTPYVVEILMRLGKSQRSQIEDKMLQILELTDEGEPFWYPPSSRVKLIERTDTRETKESGTQLGATTSFSSVGGPIVAAQGGIRGSRKGRKDLRLSRAREADGHMVFRVSSIRKRLLDIIDLLGLDFVLVCIDEWMALDPLAETDVQPEFAELLKRFLFNTGKVGVKIASNRYQTRLLSGEKGTGHRGMEIDADIFYAANLDWAILSETELEGFYEELLVKRLIRCRSDIATEYRDSQDPVYPHHALIDSIYKDRRAFRELIHGAQGIPRDFILYFNDAARAVRCNIAQRQIDHTLVHDCIHARGLTGRMTELANVELGEAFLIRCVKKAVHDSGTELFLVPRIVKCAPYNLAIQQLIRLRLVQEYPEVNLPSHVHESYKAYIVSYGTFLDWQRSFQYGNTANAELKYMSYTIPIIKHDDDVTRYVVKEEWIRQAFRDVENPS